MLLTALFVSLSLSAVTPMYETVKALIVVDTFHSNAIRATKTPRDKATFNFQLVEKAMSRALDVVTKSVHCKGDSTQGKTNAVVEAAVNTLRHLYPKENFNGLAKLISGVSLCADVGVMAGKLQSEAVLNEVKPAAV